MRFGVHTVTGFRNIGTGSSSKPGLSAHVHDTLYAYRVLRTVHSEDRLPGEGRYNIGADRALAIANEVAARLNREHGNDGQAA